MENKKYIIRIMQTLLVEIKKKVERKDSSLYDHVAIPNIPITGETISIIMTASNRSKQTYFTLQTIQNSSHKAIQVIIVDDSDVDILTKKELERYPFYIDFISIKRQNKNWINPVVNYNIGFEYIQGTKIIIQNAEVCHVGDVLGYMAEKIIPNNYYVCDVRSAKSSGANEIIYASNISTIDIYNNNSIFGIWYHGRDRIMNYHFLSGMTADTFNKIKNFSYDYTMGISYDDDDFLLKIIANQINVVNLFHDEYHFGGIHLWHSRLSRKKIESNKNIFIRKKEFYKEFGKYIDFFTEKNDPIKIEINNDTNLLELQKLFIEFTDYKIMHFYINKKNMKSEVNSFRKCILKGYCYKNSGIKIPKNLKINFYFT
jgi:hypothetical protein